MQQKTKLFIQYACKPKKETPIATMEQFFNSNLTLQRNQNPKLLEILNTLIHSAALYSELNPNLSQNFICVSPITISEKFDLFEYLKLYKRNLNNMIDNGQIRYDRDIFEKRKVNTIPFMIRIRPYYLKCQAKMMNEV